MGLSRFDIRLLTVLKLAGHDLIGSGAVMEIGAQQLSNEFLESRDELNQLAKLFGVSEPWSLMERPKGVLLHGNVEHLDSDAPRAGRFWKWLGYRYACIDVDGSPGSLSIDLNYDDVPPSERGCYQLVTNIGTTEHLANQLNAFKVIHNLTSVRGFMIHSLPAQGWPNHGLINYNPKFFWMLARSNFYEWAYLTFDGCDVAYVVPDNIVESVSVYEPDVAQHLKTLEIRDYTIYCVFKKVVDTPYVGPLDVPTGTRTSDKLLEERYWSVFDPAKLALKRIT